MLCIIFVPSVEGLYIIQKEITLYAYVVESVGWWPARIIHWRGEQWAHVQLYFHLVAFPFVSQAVWMRNVSAIMSWIETIIYLPLNDRLTQFVRIHHLSRSGCITSMTGKWVPLVVKWKPPGVCVFIKYSSIGEICFTENSHSFIFVEARSAHLFLERHKNYFSWDLNYYNTNSQP